ncbi:hypothetical protein BJX64DRAFT_292383 [Aspergillus heterothallicus]
MEDSLEEIRGLLQGRGPPVVDPKTSSNQLDGETEALPALIQQQGTVERAVEESSLSLISPLDSIHTRGANMQQLPEGLPPRHILTELSNLYFMFAHPWMNIFDQKMVETDILNLQMDCPVALDCITLFGFRYWNSSDPSVQDQQKYMENARQRLLTAAIDEISLASIQALTTLAFDALGQSPNTRALNLVSLLDTATAQLDLAQHCYQGTDQAQAQAVEPQIQTDNETDLSGPKSRLFWTIYTLDRIISVSHGINCRIRPNFFRREGIIDDHIATPARRIKVLIDDVSQRTASAAVSKSWQKLIEISTLIERVNDFILSSVDHTDQDQSLRWKSHFRALDSALTTWRGLQLTMPQRQSSEDPVELTAQAMYHAAIIRMHSVAAFPPRTSPLPLASPLAPGRCYAAVQAICSICSSLMLPVVQGPHHSAATADINIGKISGPLFVFAVWVAARNTITLWTSSWEDPKPDPPTELTTLLDALRAMAVHWPCAKQFVDMIEFVIQISCKDGCSGDGDGGGRLDWNNQSGSRQSMLAVFNDVSLTAYGLHSVLAPRIKRDRDEQMLRLWDWFAIPGLEEGNPFG